MIEVEVYEGKGADGIEKKGKKVYFVETLEEAEDVLAAQKKVRNRIFAWKALWYFAWSLPSLLLLLFLPLSAFWQKGLIALIVLALLEAKAYLVFQVRYYRTLHAGGPRKKNVLSQGLEGGEVVLTLIVFAVFLGVVGIYFDTGIDILDEWIPVLALGAIILAIFFPLILGGQSKKIDHESIVEGDNFPEIGARWVDDKAVPSDILGPGGRYIWIYNALIRLSFAPKSFSRLDINVDETAICRDGSEGRLHIAITGEWPTSNPLHLIDSFKVGGVSEIKDFLKNPAERAARRVIGSVKTIEDLLAPDVEYAQEVLGEVLGIKLTKEEVDELLNTSKNSKRYVSLIHIAINYIAVNVRPSDEQKRQLAKQAEELADRVKENIEVETVIGLVESLSEKLGVSRERAIEIAQSERGKATTATQHIKFDSDQLESFRDIAATLAKLSPDQMDAVLKMFKKKG